MHSFIHYFTHSFTNLSTYTFIQPSIHSFIHYFMHSFTHPSMHTCIHQYIHQFIEIIHNFPCTILFIYCRYYIHLSIYPPYALQNPTLYPSISFAILLSIHKPYYPVSTNPLQYFTNLLMNLNFVKIS